MRSNTGSVISTKTLTGSPDFRSPPSTVNAHKLRSISKDVTASPVTSAQVKKHTRTDPVLSEVVDIVSHGRGGEMTPKLKPYMVRRNELSVQSGCLLWGYRVIIPSPLQEKVLAELHTGHCGVVRMKEIARSYFWWPGLDAAIEEKAASCADCQKLRNQPQLAPLHPWN